jgi:hypothetical protein
VSHPNASAAAGGSGLAVIVLLTARLAWHLELTAEQGAAIAGVLATAVLFVGHNGVRGIARILWRGDR